MASDSKELARELREASYALASVGPWIYRDGLFIPKNVCSDTADIILWLAKRVSDMEDEIEELKEKKRSRLIQWR